MRGLQDLAENIRRYGVLQPIIVRPAGTVYEVVVGERRVRASIIAGLHSIPAIIRELDDQRRDELMLIENIHREDLTDSEKGDAVYELIESYPEKYETIKKVAETLNVSYNIVRANWCAKARKLSPRVAQYIANNALPESHGLLVLKYPHGAQDKLAEAMLKHELSQREVRTFLKAYDSNPDVDLDGLANKAKETRKVEIDVTALSDGARKEVERVIEENRESAERARKAAIENARSIDRSNSNRRKDLRRQGKRILLETITHQPASKTLDPYVTSPTNVRPTRALSSSERKDSSSKDIMKATHSIIERLGQIKHPRQRERMARVIPEELERIAERLEKAPERRRLVEDKLKRLYDLKSEGLFLSTIWNIGKRAEYAGSWDFHGNCPPQLIEQCILRFTGESDVILDPMAGSGTALDVCRLLNRKCVAYDLKPLREDITHNDSRIIPLEDDSIDMVFLHPPYWDMVYYTNQNDLEKVVDLSRASTLDEYCKMLAAVLSECFRVLKPNKHLCLLLGDRIKNGEFVPLCRKAANIAETIGFADRGYAVKFTLNSLSQRRRGSIIFAETAFTNNLKIEHDLVMFFRKEIP